MGFMITTSGTPGNTQVPNEILLHYLVRAGGEHVKVYLYLLMASQYPGLTGQISVETLADRMECTERDIVRALHYWEREGLLSLMEESGNVEGITLLTPKHSPSDIGNSRAFIETGTPHLKVLSSSPQVESRPYEPPAPTVSKPEIPEKTRFTPMQIEALTKDAEMRTTLSRVEQALGSPVSPTHMQLVMYLTCDLGFSGDMIAYLYELGAGRGKTKPRYLETIAIQWKNQGITTVAEAKQEADEHTGRYLPVKKALGLNRNLAPAEKEIIDGWLSYRFSDELIEEACRRTILKTGDTNLNYVSSILADWHKHDVHTMEDVRKADEAFEKQRKAKAKTIDNNGRRRVSKNAFQNFRQRDYTDEDYEALERQLLMRKESQ